MAGTYTIGEKKERPGVYHRYENAGGTAAAGALNGVGAGVFRAKWGPLNTVVEFDPKTDAAAIFGTGGTVDLITEMFTGGLSSGYFVRLGTGGAAPSLALKDAEGTVLGTIKGAYVGTRAFTVTIRDNLAGDAREFIVFDGERTFLKLTYEPSTNEVPTLEAAIAAATEDFIFVPAESASGKFADVAQAALTGGADPTVSNADYSTAFNALEAYAWNVLCVDTDTAAVHSLVQAYMNRIYEAGAYPQAVLAANMNAQYAERIANGPTFNDPKVIYLVNSMIDTSGNIYAGYLAAARIGGMIASIPSNQSPTHAVITGMAKVSEALTDTQIKNGLKKGCLVLSTNSAGQVWIEKGINTLITPDETQDDGWKKIRRIKTRFELMQRIDDTIEGYVGNVNNDDDGRAAVVAAGQGVINTMWREKKLKEGGQMYEDPDNPAQGDDAWFVIAVDDIDSIEKIYLLYKFRFSDVVQ